MTYREYTMEKLAANPAGAAAQGGASALARILKPSIAATFVGGMGLKMLYDKFKRDQQAARVLEDLMHSDPIISKEDPEVVKQYAATVFNIAPAITHDKNVMKGILQNFIKFGTVDVKTIETLAGIQKTMGESQSKSFPFAAAPLLGKLL